MAKIVNEIKKIVSESEEKLEFIEDHIQNEIHKAVEKTKAAQLNKEHVDENADLPLYRSFSTKKLFCDKIEGKAQF